MSARKLQPHARLVMLLQALFHGAEAMCTIFVAVYFWINSLNFNLVCAHYLALFTVTPVVFLFAGWYAQARDRLHVYRLGLVLHVVYYGALLLLRENSPDYAIHLGAFLGLTWGIYWVGAHTFNFDVTTKGRREYYFGTLQAIIGVARLIAPLLGGLIISLSPDNLFGYHVIFALVICIYILCFILSFKMPHDREPRPFNIRRALFPGKDQRDWQLVMAAAVSLAGAFHIFMFLLGLIMYMETDNEMAVGGFASFQAVVGATTAFIFGRIIIPENRRKYMLFSTCLLVAAGLVIATKITVLTLLIFGFLRSMAGSTFAITHFSLRLDVISESVQEPSQRIEYLCAWEVPLAIGRIIMMLTLMGLYSWLSDSSLGLRLTLLTLCSLRIVTYAILRKSSILSRYG